MTHNTPNIDIPRLFADLEIHDGDLADVASLPIPKTVLVTSASAIKVDTVQDVLGIVMPDTNFNVAGVKAASDVAEQPLGQIAIDGALNRLNNGIRMREADHPGDPTTVVWISIENGLFVVSSEHTPTDEATIGTDNIQFNGGANLSTKFDLMAEYEDRAVVVIRIPGYPTVVQISPDSEAVPVPKEAVLAAYVAEGGFELHTAGSKLAEMGLVADKQNPHIELSADREGGPLPRQDQMARAIIRALLHLTQQPITP